MIPVFKPKLTIKDINAVNKTLKKNEISGSFGKSISEFEINFSKYIGSRYSVTTSSGTTALHLAIDILNLPKKSEIILSSCTNIATALCIVHNNHIPIPVDSNINTWNIDVDKIEKLITKKTKAIIIVHFLGKPVEIEKILYLKKKYKLKIIEDAAEAHGAIYKNKKIGNFGDLSCFSFYANKIITSGEGGMICTNNKTYFKRIKLYKNLGFTKPRFVHFINGYNFRMTAIQAAIGNSQLLNIEKIINSKIRIAKRYIKNLSQIREINLPQINNYERNVFWQFGICMNDNSQYTKIELMNYLKKKKIDTRSFFFSIRNQPCLKNIIPKNVPKTPMSNKLWRNGLYLPSSHNIKNSEIDFICNKIKEFFE